MSGRQIEFPPNQQHSKKTEVVLLAICALCIVFVLIAITTVSGGVIPE